MAILIQDVVQAGLPNGYTGSAGVIGYTGSVGSPSPRAIAIASPSSTENVTFFYTPTQITLSSLRAVVRGTSPSVSFTVRWASDRSLTGTEVVTGGSTVTNTTTGLSVTTFNAGTISAGSWVWVAITATSGTVTEFHLSVNY